MAPDLRLRPAAADLGEAVGHIMGTRAHVVVDGPDAQGLADDALRRLSDLEAAWSRFRATSEVSDLNRHAGEWRPIGPDTVTLLEAARQGWQSTEGWFDSTVLPTMLAAGYDRDLAALPRASTSPALLEPGAGATTPGAIQVDRSRGRARLARGTGFDPGGVGKGLAADLVVAALVARGATRAMVNVGGDLVAHGDDPDGGPWGIDVTGPSGSTVLRLRVADRAVATTAAGARGWHHTGVDHHHLVDPRGTVARRPWLEQVTVVARSGATAEVVAKAVLLGGPRVAERVLQRHGATAFGVTLIGDVVHLGGASPATAAATPTPKAGGRR